MRDFKNEVICEPSVDGEHELYVRAWTAYFEAANQKDDNRSAVTAGRLAMAKYVPPEVIDNIIKTNDHVSYARWNSAKNEALRRIKETK